MEHTDDGTLTLVALGEDPSPSVSRHLRECSRCRQELAGLRRVATAMKAPSADDDDLLDPPADLWDSIAQELNLSVPEYQATATTHRKPPDRPSAVATDREPSDFPLAVVPDLPAAPAADRQAPATDGDRAPGKRRRLARFTIALAACAALLGAAAGSTITWWITHDNTAVAAAPDDGNRLDSLQADSAGYASLSDSDGQRTLDITVKGLPETSGYFEVWLMDRSHTKLISMGVLGPDGHATLPVPDNVDLNEYSEVDVSVQPYNGKPDHSGDSLVRGPYAG
ncbi:anti-sigma factor [Streptomyces sp. NPDC000983]|uniref:anti-sigma factor n=1 Tax=Streptomyces sp. NPDC000983 TaxID=3154373 RepID=UPI00332C82C3